MANDLDQIAQSSALFRLYAAAKAVRDAADGQFEHDGDKPIAVGLLSELTEAVEVIEFRFGPAAAAALRGEG